MIFRWHGWQTSQANRIINATRRTFWPWSRFILLCIYCSLVKRTWSHIRTMLIKIFLSVYLFSLFGRHDLPPIRMHMMTMCVYLNFYVSFSFIVYMKTWNIMMISILVDTFREIQHRCHVLAVGLRLLNVGLVFIVGGLCDFWPWNLGDCHLWIHPHRSFRNNSLFIISHHQLANDSLQYLQVGPLNINSKRVTQSLVIYFRSYKDKTGKMRSFFEAARPLYPLFALFLISSAWALFSANRILEKDPRMFFMMTGTIFSNISCRLIVAQMSDTRTDGWNFQLTLMSFATVICIFPYQLLKFQKPPEIFETYVLYTLAAVTSILHFHYGVCVVSY